MSDGEMFDAPSTTATTKKSTTQVDKYNKLQTDTLPWYVHLMS